MNNFKPKGRSSLPKELLQFGRHLVYAEGTKTEPNYIDSIKNEIATKYQCSQNEINIIPVVNGKTHNTIHLVDFVKKDIDKRLKKKERIDHVWLFFDKDDFPLENFISANIMIKEMNDSKVKNNDGFSFNKETNISWHSCFSNEAFELWYCLYFGQCNTEKTRKDYKKILNKKLKKGYSKKEKNMHQLLVEKGGSIEKAIKNAKKLKGLKTYSNPSTGVYEFAEYFLAYMK